jgi:hypothetical protein
VHDPLLIDWGVEAMKMRNWLAAVLAIAVASSVQAQERRLFGRPFCPPPCECPPGYPPATAPDSTKPGTQPPAIPPETNAFNEALASAGEAGTQPATSYMPGMFGDILGGFITTRVFIPALDGFVTVQIPNASQAAGYKISENESPRPVDRVFYNYNFYGNIHISPQPDVPLMQLHRHVIGFEKTFLDGNASVGLRLPFLNTEGDPSFQSATVGDLSVVLKYALINDKPAGDVLSFGLVITTPTAETPLLLDPNGTRTLAVPQVISTILQPWFGYIYNVTPELYLHGFHSVSIPTDANDVMFMSNDVGVGYWLYRNEAATLQGIIPTVEIHVNSPFNHRTVGPVIMSDQTTLTCGSYFIFSRATVGGAVGIPMYGPNRIEAIASVNMRF